MKVLWVKAGKLLPVDTGGKIRSYNLLRHLAAYHDVTLLSYYGGRRDPAYEAELGRHFPLAVTVHTGAPDGSPIDYARRVLSAAPYAVTKFTSPHVSRLIQTWYREARFDVAVCDFLSASLNFPATLSTPSVLFQHNVESVLWRRQAAHEPNPVKRLAFTLEAAKMARYERTTVRRFPHVIAVSERDRRELMTMTGMTEPSRLSVVPTGVDVDRYRVAARSSAVQPLVMFLGSMDWEANVDAVEYFCGEIWPAVRSAVPSARFRIVGRNPHPRVLTLASDSVNVTGGVPSVVDHLREAAVCVVPLRVGGGTRLKIFEAMAAGKAVVSTTVGAEGLDLHDGRDVVLADTASRFADAVIDLLRDPARRRRLEIAATELAARYDWSVIARQFEAILRKVAATPVARAFQPGDRGPERAALQEPRDRGPERAALQEPRDRGPERAGLHEHSPYMDAR
jgi:glycosyltransferase involved in cell wall biosynthesis